MKETLSSESDLLSRIVSLPWGDEYGAQRQADRMIILAQSRTNLNADFLVHEISAELQRGKRDKKTLAGLAYVVGTLLWQCGRMSIPNIQALSLIVSDMKAEHDVRLELLKSLCHPAEHYSDEEREAVVRVLTRIIADFPHEYPTVLDQVKTTLPRLKNPVNIEDLSS